MSYRELLAGIHQTANLLHSLGLGPRDAVGILLPGCLEYHLALWGGEGGLRGAAAESAAIRGQAGGAAERHRRARADRLRRRGRLRILDQALRLRERVPSLRSLLRVAPMDEPASARPRCRKARWTSTPRAPPCRPTAASGRRIQGSDVAAYFHTGGTTGARLLAIHTHANQVFTAWAAVQLQNAGPGDVVINGYPLFHVAGALPASLAALSAGVATIIPTTQLLRNREVLRNYWRLVERHRATSLQGVPTILAALAEVPLDGADISSLRYCRTGARRCRPNWPRASSGNSACTSTKAWA